MYKIIACDLDETLISLDRTISKENIDAIQRAVEAGVRFVPATGRGYHCLGETLKELGLYQKKDEYVISYNGGAITENKDERILHFQGITFDEAQALYKRGLQYEHICIHIYTPDMVWVRNFYPEEVEYLASRQQCTEIYSDDIEFLRGKEIVKAIYMNTDFDYLKSYMEFNRKGVSKGAALKRLAEMLNVDIHDTIAIGDNYNDLSMIQTAGLGIGVANTIEGMKKDCDYITQADCDHSAIAEVINRFIFGKGEM